MPDDEKSHEISVSGELTTNGFTARIKSRALSALDRLLGSKAAKKSAPNEAETAEILAASEVRIKLMKAAGDVVAKRIEDDPALAERAIENLFPKLLRQQENKDAVVQLALEDLRESPTPDGDSGPEQLDEAFLNRIERYSEDASSEQVRERWAKVLASEIRKPGTFSGKALRIVDELEPTVALEFEKFCQYRLGDIVPTLSVGTLKFDQTVRFVDAGLIVDPGFSGQVTHPERVTDDQGNHLWFWGFSEWAFAIPHEPVPPAIEKVLQHDDGKPVLPVYILTTTGSAIASILPAPQMALPAALGKLQASYPGLRVWSYRQGDGRRWHRL